MPGRQDEAIPVRPGGIRWTVAEKAGPESVRHRGGPHGEPRVSRLRLLDSIHGEGPDGVDAQQVHDFRCV